MKSEKMETYRLPPGIEVIELEDGDRPHEVYVTDWTEFQEPQYGPNWRFVLLSVIRKSGELEFALIRQYEYAGKDVVAHMKGRPENWVMVMEHAIQIARAGSVHDPKYPVELEFEKSTWDAISGISDEDILGDSHDSGYGEEESTEGRGETIRSQAGGTDR